MVKTMNGFGREADALRKQADGLVNGSDKDQLHDIARDFDALAVIAARDARPAAKPAPATPAGKTFLGRTGLSCFAQLYKRRALAVAFLLLAVPAWSAGADGPSPPPAAACPRPQSAAPITPGSATEHDDAVPDPKSGTTDPIAAGSSGVSQDESIGTSSRPTPRLELPNNDAGVVPRGGG